MPVDVGCWPLGCLYGRTDSPVGDGLTGSARGIRVRRKC